MLNSMSLKSVAVVITLSVISLAPASAAAPSPQQALKWKVDDFKMYFTAALKEDVLKTITDVNSNGQIAELANWPYAPFEIQSSFTNGDFRVRFEKDFLVIWYHSSVSLVEGKNNPIDVVRQAVNAIVAEPFAIGENDTLFAAGSSIAPTPKIELTMFTWPQEIPGTKAIICGYYSIDSHKRYWLPFDVVEVLVKEKDAVIVMEQSKARQQGSAIYYEGLLAAKVRLKKEEAEKFKDKPILARNVIFDAQTDTNSIPDRILNGCMWPIDNKRATGIRYVGPVSQLRPEPKKYTNATDPNQKPETKSKQPVSNPNSLPARQSAPQNLQGISAKLQDKWLLDAKQAWDLKHTGKMGIHLGISYLGMQDMPDPNIVISHHVKSLKIGDISVAMTDGTGAVSICNKSGFGRFFLPEEIVGLENLKPGKYPVVLVLEGDIYKSNTPNQPLEHWQITIEKEIELNALLLGARPEANSLPARQRK